MSLISLENITAGYGKEDIIRDINLEINAGELVGIVGLNGCGKSTLAKAVCNILLHSGRVRIDGKHIEEQCIKDKCLENQRQEDTYLEKLSVKQVAGLVSYVPQQSGISIDISAFDVVMMGFNPRLGLFENPGSEMKKKAEEIIDALGLTEYRNTNFMLLSQGQKQLVILARALVSQGLFLVMDEPESALDLNVRYKMMSRVRNWVGGGSRAGLVILHDISLALNNCDRIVLLKDKGIAAIINVKGDDEKGDTLEEIEGKLSAVYDNIKLAKVVNKSGHESYACVCDQGE